MAETDKERQAILEGSADYQLVLSAMQLLRQQLEHAKLDIKRLQELKAKAIEFPLETVEHLRAQTLTAPPKLQQVVLIPDIDWSQYPSEQDRATSGSAARYFQHPLLHRVCPPMASLRETELPSNPQLEELQNAEETILARDNLFTTATQSTTQPNHNIPSTTQETTSSPGKRLPQHHRVNHSTPPAERKRLDSHGAESDAESMASTSRSKTLTEQKTDGTSTRKRKNSDTKEKPETYNQPWSEEEQERLERLLEIYPHEAVQAQRWEKISKALGTRNPRQVASRVQKYFIKLAKHGLEVPGTITIPPSALSKAERMALGADPAPRKEKIKTASPRVSQKPSHAGYNAMVSGGITNTRISGSHYLNVKARPSVLMLEDEDGTLPSHGKAQAVHLGYVCDACGAEPIVGVRYKCIDCPEEEEVDLCSDCYAQKRFENGHHLLSHAFEAIHSAEELPYYEDSTEFAYLGSGAEA
ncbi:hypothetical protein BZG36_02024 [Bifiguratus adelaidae]|uniref:ZZ-type domain-containing protein n=1 Tax=Bifiguratus adelaidae TaxID=1938954 RepID=A0A261Y1Y2_9FUNG|nr:hypothetical protein BZG36_02024 [Bifiguratus adelaidae]